MEPNKSLEGATSLAAAVVLCNKPGIQVPDEIHEEIGIKADQVLCDWNQLEIKTLLERGIFNDVIYRSVRFRHREIREFLAAEWFSNLLEKRTARHKIEALFFRKQYGENIVSPRLRSILPWLILKDRAIRSKVLDEYPEIALEGETQDACHCQIEKKSLTVYLLVLLKQAINMDKTMRQLLGSRNLTCLIQPFRLSKNMSTMTMPSFSWQGWLGRER